MRHLPKNIAGLVERAYKAEPSRKTALTSLHSLDLTSLNDDDTSASIEALIAKTDYGALGHVAATCVYPKFLTQTFNATAKNGIHRATVINFPSGCNTPEKTAADTREALAKGANEIDIVLDYGRFLSGDRHAAEALLHTCRQACGTKAKMKVILETAAFDDYADLYAASVLALSCGADFLKTSTGKSHKGGATLEAVATLLQAIRDTGSKAGLKVSGGIKTVTDCARQVSLVESMMGRDWITTDTFRIGASGVLGDILQTLGEKSALSPSPSGY